MSAYSKTQERKRTVREDKKREYLEMLQQEQEHFLNRQPAKPQLEEPESGCCFSCFFSRKSNTKSRPSGKKQTREEIKASMRSQKGEQVENEEQKPETHGFSTSLTSNEWIEYLLEQVEKNTQSSSVQILGFNWAEQLAEFIDDMMDKKVGFAVQKYRSAIFYHNYSVRQMRIESEIDGLIKRKQTQLNKKLRKLD